MEAEDEYVWPDEEYDDTPAPAEAKRDRSYGVEAEEVDLRTVDMADVDVIGLRDRLLQIGFVTHPETGVMTKDPAWPHDPFKSWEGFFSAKPTSSDCTKDVYAGIANFDDKYYVEWFSGYTVAELCKCVRAMVSGTLPTIDGGKAARAYAGKATLSEGEWVDEPDAKTLSLPVTKRLASSAQMFCASVDLKMKDRLVKIEGVEKMQVVNSPTLVPANVDGANSIDPLWKRKFLPLLQLPTAADGKRKLSDDASVRKAPFIWSVIGRKYGTEIIAGTNIRPMNYYLFWKKELYPLVAAPINLMELFNCNGTTISRALIARVIEHSIWVGGFPTPGDAIIAKFLDCEDFVPSEGEELLALSGPFSKAIIGFCTTTGKFEGPNVKFGNPDLEHEAVGISSSAYDDYTGVYWNPSTRHIAHLKNIQGIAIPYSSAPGALAVAWDFLKLRCKDGSRIYATYGANPVLWILKSGNNARPSVNNVTKLFKSCAWVAIVNFSVSTSRGFYNKDHTADDRYIKRCIWGAELIGGEDQVTWWYLQDSWVPGRWIDNVAAVDLSLPPDLWDEEDDGKPAEGAGDGDTHMGDRPTADAPKAKR